MTATASIPPALLDQLLFQMKRIRAYELEIAKRYPEGQMRCPTHLSVGQEAVPAAVHAALAHEDLAVSTHRGHAHYLGKGGSGKRMIAEIYGKATGCAKGKGGSMHLVDLSVGFKGTTAIVGNTIPVGVGLGLALQLERKPNLACIFLGDGAIEEGAFFESANFAALRRLPVLFLCENNLYSVYSGLEVRQPKGRRIHELVRALGIPSSAHDGNDVEACYSGIAEAASAVRAGGGPRFMEFATYRWLEHCGPAYDNHIGYRTEAEFQSWKAQDPIPRAESKGRAQGWLTDARLQAMDAEIAAEVAEAFRFAEASPFPEAAEAYAHVYQTACGREG
jgi:TPP-dependent pyruvate/acetoin dehydrogenase alpha subunit